MRKLHHLAILASLALIAAAPLCRAGDRRASAEISILEDKDRAKLDVQELKQAQKQLELDDLSSGTDSNSNCGSVNIGNDNGKQTGSGRAAPHDTTVIVTGNVFNTATCGR
ncbi:MAG TPA: hypothetical protein VNW98_09240 [Burkholderiaceae bacterium]|jgi:hypothetical protein|nr:hypothetical protein [Burkholderiaceae bacterium]